MMVVEMWAWRNGSTSDSVEGMTDSACERVMRCEGEGDGVGEVGWRLEGVRRVREWREVVVTSTNRVE